MKNPALLLLMTMAVVISASLQARADIRVTAGTMKAAADSAALTFANDAALAVVTSSDVDTLGKSLSWLYAYFSLNASREYDFHTQDVKVIFDSAHAMRIGVGVLNQSWINSDSAIAVAEHHGGSSFRNKFPAYSIMASIFRPVAPPNLSYWRIEYKSVDSTMVITINATTGDVVSPNADKDQLDYYPLRTRNYWEYKVDSHDCNLPQGPCDEDTSAYSIEAVGDTVLSNGHHYETMAYRSIYPTRDTFYFYERTDSTTGSVFKYNTRSTTNERQIDSLFADSGDFFLTTTKFSREENYSFKAFCRKVRNGSIFGIATQLKDFGEASLYEDGYTLAKGFGICEISAGWDFGSSATALVYAKINGIEYGTKIPLGVVAHPPTETTFSLFQNFPNPFNPSTVISYQLPMASHVTLNIYDVLGRQVAILVNEKQTAGQHSINFKAGNLPSGVYFYRLATRSYIATKKMILLK